MTATVHAIIGAALATKIGEPVSLAFASTFSHLLMDCIPHWDFGAGWRMRSKWATGTLAILETLIGITLTYFLFWGKAPLPILTIGILFSELPDWLEAPWFLFFAKTSKKNMVSDKDGLLKKMSFAVYHFQQRFHVKAPLPLGGITQILVVVLALSLTS